MVSKNQSKFIKSLKIKKFRVQEGLFLVEGRKNVLELIQSDFEIKWILVTQLFMETHLHELKKVPSESIHETTSAVLTDVGTFKTNHECIAVVKAKERNIKDLKLDKHLVVLDGVGDPGNLGTIIRTLDWFGFESLVCSTDAAEFYNPKVINSTMGSFCRVKVFYTNLETFLSEHKEFQILSADMFGMDIGKADFNQPSIIVMGSESHGISEEVAKLEDGKISIPNHGAAESLNVAIATGIVAYKLTENSNS